MNMPTPKNATRTLAEVREECIALGLTPARSIAQCEARIQLHRDTQHDAVRHAGDAKRVEELAEVRAKLLPEDRWPPEAEPEAKRAEADRVAEKTARHALAFGAGAGLFMSAAAALGWTKTSPDLREMASSFDRAARNRPRASVPGSVRRKMQRDAAKNGG